MVNLHPINSICYANLFPQNGERILTIDSVTSFHPMYRPTVVFSSIRKWKHVTDVLPFF